MEETISQPLKEYIVGVLVPKDLRSDYATYLDGIAGKPVECDQEEPESAATVDTVSDEPDLEGEMLDPRFARKSFGISFQVTCSNEPRVNICATWARYEPTDQKRSSYKRRPDATALLDILLGEGRNVLFNGRGVQIVAFVKRIGKENEDRRFHVSIYFVNTTEVSRNQRLVPEICIFQPQLRISVGVDTQVVATEVKGVDDTSGTTDFELLFRSRPTYGRGHMCSAVWKYDFADPELPPDDNSQSPFCWVDYEYVQEKYNDPRMKRLFLHPDLRTEFLPFVLVQQVRHGPHPDFQRDHPSAGSLETPSAGTLAETYDPNQLHESLSPLLELYDEWIEWTDNSISNLPPEYHLRARSHLDAARASLRRMRMGLEILGANATARLAFCFMNKAMDIQRRWTNSRRSISAGLQWYPFQIAFILQCIPEIVDPRSYQLERRICDLLWFPTGGGKTEAYLGLAVFVLAFRRLKHGVKGLGTGVLSRYTLRLLTIQQFRRALVVLTACEKLRVDGWMPSGAPRRNNPWGTVRFSVGLWVGRTVSPNWLSDALSNLRNPARAFWGDPAQVLTCPCCGALLAVAASGLSREFSTIGWVVRANSPPQSIPGRKLGTQVFRVRNSSIVHDLGNGYYVIAVEFSYQGHPPDRRDAVRYVERWWSQKIAPQHGDPELVSFHSARPGYFPRRDALGNVVDFEIRCTNPECDLFQSVWQESTPLDNGVNTISHEAFQVASSSYESRGIPIPAYTIDPQVYHRCPSMVVGTVDKFARLPFEPRSSAIFGNVDTFDSIHGFYRASAPPPLVSQSKSTAKGRTIRFKGFLPPTLIIQDELHLINGPLGSMVGIYETAVDELCTHDETVAKYVASSATVRNAKEQTQAVFSRSLAVFPPPGIRIEDNFFSHWPDAHAATAEGPGRVYLGVCTAKDIQSVTYRVWAALLTHAFVERNQLGPQSREADAYWTCVGYFNAIRELANVRSLYRQDIPLRIGSLSSAMGIRTRNIRALSRLIELSSNITSSEVPGLLSRLQQGPPSEVDALLTTSMFGVGVDVSRLSLMIVHGQPKTTSDYIQATGRVGRDVGGLVVTIYRPSRPRDLAHFEFFVGYHRALLKYTEPVTVFPFSTRCRSRTLGPVAVALLRNARHIGGVPVQNNWAREIWTQVGVQSGARDMRSLRNSPEVRKLEDVFENRSSRQPPMRQPAMGETKFEIQGCLDDWERIARRHGNLIYSESTFRRLPQFPVVLGTISHETHGRTVVFPRAPQSLRDVEPIARFGVR